MDSYLRRKQWEMEQQAVHIINALAAGLAKKEEKANLLGMLSGGLWKD